MAGRQISPNNGAFPAVDLAPTAGTQSTAWSTSTPASTARHARLGTGKGAPPRRLRGRTRPRATMMFVRGRMVDVDLGDLDRWCRAHLSAGVDEVPFRDGYLSTVLGVRLSSGQPVVVKVRRRAERLQACWMAHCQLFERGFPCPQPLVAPQPFGEWVASAEAAVVGGELFPDSGRAPHPFAAALARLVALAPVPDDLPSLDPRVPWTAWAHEEQGLWPWTDDGATDLQTSGGPASNA